MMMDSRLANRELLICILAEIDLACNISQNRNFVNPDPPEGFGSLREVCQARMPSTQTLSSDT